MRYTYLLAGAACLSACGNAVPKSNAGSGATASFEVAGIRTGMSVDAARAVLQAKGFTVEIKPFRSYENALEDAAARRKGVATGVEPDQRGVMELHGKKGSEEVTLAEIAPGTENGTVLGLTYSIALAGRSSREIRADVIKRYGAPTRVSGPNYIIWCSAGDTCNPRSGRRPTLVYDDGSPVVAILGLHGGSDLREREEARFADAVSRRAGKQATSF